jgi:ATP-dependent helicase/nuclease subunit B
MSTASRRTPHVFSIAAGLRFLPTFVDALMRGMLVPGFPDHDPLSLASATIFLPTRRAARALSALLAERAAGSTRLLPRIIPLGDIDDTEIGLGDAEFTTALDKGALPPSIGNTARRLILSRLVLAFARSVDRGMLRLSPDEALLVPSSPADAFALAGDLGRLMDALTAEDVDWARLGGLVEERYDRYYSVTLDFLKIAAEAWPGVLEERGLLDPVVRRDLVLRAEAKRLLEDQPPTPMIAAGSTGSLPATARLLAAISRLPNGAVVLPDLDHELDDKAWQAIGIGAEDDVATHGHPQAVLHRLLAEIGIDRPAVMPLGELPQRAAARGRFLSQALRPAATTEQWAPDPQRDSRHWADALHGVAVVEAGDEREEALVASLVIREALETPDATAALITPDRGLAERVGAELKRWDIDVDDSAGAPLTRTPPGRLALLAAEAAAADYAPRQLLALLAHPLVTLGASRASVTRASAALEIGLLRGPAPPRGLDGLLTILPQRRAEARARHAARPLRRLTDADWASVADLVRRIERAFAPFLSRRSSSCDLAELALRHREVLVALAQPVKDEADRLFVGEAGEAIGLLFDDVAMYDGGAIEGRFEDYPAFFARLAGEYRVRPRRPRHRRVKIWGPLEARLLDVDTVVVGGLDEGVWPPVAKTDAFLNRPMRAAMGLPPPERRIGQTAHDFVAALGTRRAVITRATKRDGAPTVPSRFLQRMQAVAGGDLWKTALAGGARYRALAAMIDRPVTMLPLPRPAPRPPRDLIPRSLSVTEIETLVRDPYSIFAKHVLKLDALDGVAELPGASDRGTIVHEALGRFAAAHPHELPDNPLQVLIAFGEQAFAALAAYPDVAAQWWPRFERLAEAFIRWEHARRPSLAAVHTEIAGAMPLAVGESEPFMLRARADRIERGHGGTFAILDFKTGTPPSAKTVFAGFSPQLTLEAAILKHGGFKDIPATQQCPALEYLHATGGVIPLNPYPIEPPVGEARTVAAIVGEHCGKLEKLMRRYILGEAGFMARPFVQFARRFNEYDHLARTKEWALADDALPGETS